jgi:hypothetical protein
MDAAVKFMMRKVGNMGEPRENISQISHVCYVANSAEIYKVM